MGGIGCSALFAYCCGISKVGEATGSGGKEMHEGSCRVEHGAWRFVDPGSPGRAAGPELSRHPLPKVAG